MSMKLKINLLLQQLTLLEKKCKKSPNNYPEPDMADKLVWEIEKKAKELKELIKQARGLL